MTRFLSLLVLLALGSVGLTASAQRAYFVAPNGSVLGSGTITSPITLANALARVAPGDTIYVRGGSYTSTSSIRIDKSGTDGAYIHIWAYPADDEAPVFDFTDAGRGFDIRGDYVHLKGLVAERSNDNGVYVKQASYTIVEQMVSRYNGDSGIQMEDGSAYNLLLNNDSYENYDPGNNGENADGFAIKFGVGPGNVLRGNRAWANSDDGYDFWSLDDPAQQGVRIEGNWAFHNGFNIWNDPAYRGDSNGFKLGKGNGAHVLIRNVAWDHLAHGFDVNGNASGVTVYHNTAYLNRGVNFNFDDDPAIDEQAPYVLRNNVSLAASVRMDDSVTDEAANSWNSSVDRASAADFVSLDDSGADGPRQADGSLPDLNGFLHLVASSDLIDLGEDVGLPYAGAAPDLGAYEFDGGGTAGEPGAEASQALALAGPNPVRTGTRVAVTLDASRVARVSVHDVLGREVVILADGPLPGGRSLLALDAADLAVGLYVVRLRTAVSQSSLPITVSR